MPASRRDPALVTDLGTVLVTGGSGFVGCNFVRTLLEKGYRVRSFDLVASPLPAQPNLEVIQGNICDYDTVLAACAGIDTVFHTAALIDLNGGKAATEEYRQRSFAVNVGGTENIIRACQAQGVRRLVYTASNSVVIGGKSIANGDESLPYTTRFNDLYTETKVKAEQLVLASNGQQGLLTCSVRPSGIWGPGDQTMFKRLFTEVVAGRVKVLIGGKKSRLDNSYVHNLIHGQILAARHLIAGGTAPGQAYFINDGEPINMFEFARPVVEACGAHWPSLRIPGSLVRFVMVVWERLHFSIGFPEPPLPPLAVERLYLHNYFSIEKARRELGYRPLFTTAQAMQQCLPYYIDMYRSMEAEHRGIPQTSS